jgi:hypothetical protein
MDKMGVEWNSRKGGTEENENGTRDFVGVGVSVHIRTAHDLQPTTTSIFLSLFLSFFLLRAAKGGTSPSILSWRTTGRAGGKAGVFLVCLFFGGATSARHLADHEGIRSLESWNAKNARSVLYK